MHSTNNITERTNTILKEIQNFSNVSLVLATKTHYKFSVLQSALGCSKNIIIAENRIQEAENKYSVLLKFSHKKHFIGYLQSNKVRKAVQIFDCIETVDSLKLLTRINKIAGELAKNIEIFLNINISNDEKKSGILPENIENFISEIQTKYTNKNSDDYLDHINIIGLFTILKNNLSDSKKHEYYGNMKKLQIEVQKKIPSIIELSMGMSGDYHIALQEGATHVRIGRGIFGERSL